MSESILGSTNFSISNELSKLCTLTKVENIEIPGSNAPKTISIDSDISYIVIELAGIYGSNYSSYGASPSGYVSHAIIPYKSSQSPSITFQNGSSMYNLTIAISWPSDTQLTLYNTYGNSYYVNARIGHFK